MMRQFSTQKVTAISLNSVKKGGTSTQAPFYYHAIYKLILGVRDETQTLQPC